MREQGLSSKLLDFKKQLEDHEVPVLDLDRQVAVLELGTKHIPAGFRCGGYVAGADRAGGDIFA